MKLKFLFLIFLYFSLSYSWEINTHRAIVRCAIVEDKQCARGTVAKNLLWFAENYIPRENGNFESYRNEKLEGYKINNSDVTYFEYVLKGEKDGISKWNQSFSSYDYLNLIEAGSILEDALYPNAYFNFDGRFNNHFYDPQNNGKGLTYGYGNRVDAVTWGMFFINSQTLVNEYCYEKALEYYKKGFIEINSSERKKNRAKMFVTLGYLLHLLQDMHVPAHTRDDSHPFGDPLEKWMRGGENGFDDGGFKILKSKLYLCDKNILQKVKEAIPFKYSSFKEFYVKQANFTGKNFYSEDSISLNGVEYFHDYSKYSPTKDEITIPDEEGYILSNRAEILNDYNKLAVKVKGKVWGYNYYYITEKFNKTLVENGVNLIPQAVAASEGLVNYFFRGRLKASLSSDGILKITNISDPSLVSNEDVVSFKENRYKVYYETDENQTFLLKECIAPYPLKVNDSFDCDISQELTNKQNVIGQAKKLSIVYDGIIGNERGISVAIAKKLTNSDILFSFDRSGSMGSDIEYAKNSAKDILDNIIGVDNNSTYIEIEAFNSYATVLLPFENNVTKAKNAIDTIYSGGGTALYDAIKLAGKNAVSHKLSSGISKSIVILYTDGRENSSYSTRQEAIDAISNAKAPEIDEVFLIFVGNDAYGQAELKAIADAAGRKFMSVNDASELKDAIEQILKSQ